MNGNSSRKTGRFYGVGVGPGDPELITFKAASILSRVKVVFVPRKGEGSTSRARTIISSFIRGEQEVIELVFPMTRDRAQLNRCWQQAADSIWQRLERGEDCAFINLGDPFLFGTCVHLLEILRRQYPGVEVEIVPGISSINAAAARALVPLAIDDDRVAILSGESDDEFVKQTIRNFDTVIIMKINSAFDRLFAILKELNVLDRCHYVERCTSPEEKVVTDIASLKGTKLDYFSLLIVRR